MNPGLLIFFVLGWNSLASAANTVYKMETVAGSGSIGDGGPATAAQIGNIQGIAMDRSGNLYLSDTDSHRVRKVSPGGTITCVAGTGTAGFSGDGGPATSAQLNLPWGLAADGNGNVYVADLGNNRVRRISPDGTITTVAGNGEKGSAGNSGNAIAAQLMGPRNLAVDAAGNLYIAESEAHRVRKVSPGGQISPVAGIGIAGFRGDRGAALNAQLQYPDGLAVDRAGALYIADSENRRVRKVSPQGIIDTVVSNSSATPLLALSAVAVDGAGTIYVGDQSRTVHGLTSAGAWVTVASVYANDLMVDGGGSLYIAENMQVARITGGSIHFVAGDAYQHVGDGSAATDAQLHWPTALAFDAAGNLYIADSGTARVRRVAPTGQITTAAGTWVAGYSGENVPAITAQLNSPQGVAVDAFGNLFIADTNNLRLRQVGVDGRIRTLMGTGAPGFGEEGLAGSQTPLNGPQAVCLDRFGALYIVDSGNHRVLRLTTGSAVLTAAGNGSPGDAGDGGLARMAELNLPAACALDTAGNLYIADKANHRIRKVTPAGQISTVAGTGAWGFSGDGGPAIAATLNLPAGIAVDDANLYIGDTANNRVRKVTADGVIQTIAGGNLADPLSRPRGLMLDGSGALYFADTGNNLVRKLSPVIMPPEQVTDTGPLSVLNAASLLAGSVAPGELLDIFGSGLGPETGATASFDDWGMQPTQAGGTEVRFDGVPAPVFYAQAGQVNVQAPYGIAGAAATKIEVRYQDQPVASATLSVSAASPALYSVITNQDGSPNSETAPAPRNSVVTLYGTGEGLTDGANVAGVAASPPYPQPILSPALTIAGMPVEILSAASAPGMAGVLRIDARVPAGFVPSGQSTVVLTMGSSAAPPISIWLQ